MEAFSASMFVWSAMSLITSTIPSISSMRSRSLRTSWERRLCYVVDGLHRVDGVVGGLAAVVREVARPGR